MDEIRDIQNRFDRAELEADLDTLHELIADDFLSIGPRGFVLDKRQWIDRHDLLTYHALDTSELDIRPYGSTAVVRDVQRNRATYDADDVAVNIRVSQVWVRQEQGCVLDLATNIVTCRGPGARAARVSAAVPIRAKRCGHGPAIDLAVAQLP